MTDEEIVALYLRMDSRFAAWAVRAARFPREVWHAHRIYNVYHYVHHGAVEEHPTTRGLIRPTELGIAAAELYCEQSGLRVDP